MEDNLGLKDISIAGGVAALNIILSGCENLSSSRRNYYLRFFIQEKIDSILIIDTKNLIDVIQEIEVKFGKDKPPHQPGKDQFLKSVVETYHRAKGKNVFGFATNQLFLISNNEGQQLAEKLLGQMGLLISYYRIGAVR